jgi:hypothetical protein
MAHFAILGKGNIVENVIVVDNNDAPTEQAGISFLKKIYNDPYLIAVQTSYNTKGGIHYGINNIPDGGIALRANYAGVGYQYDQINDVFYPPKPVDINNIICNSWTLSGPTWLWSAPTPEPTNVLPEGQKYGWNEITKEWVVLGI